MRVVYPYPYHVSAYPEIYRIISDVMISVPISSSHVRSEMSHSDKLEYLLALFFGAKTCMGYIPYKLPDKTAVSNPDTYIHHTSFYVPPGPAPDVRTKFMVRDWSSPFIYFLEILSSIYEKRTFHLATALQ